MKLIMKESIKNNKILLVCKWIFFNLLFFIFGIFGLYFKVEWALNIFLFFLWVTVITGFMSFIPDVRKKIQERGRSVPEWMSITVDIILVCMLASVGRFVSATFWFIQISLEKYGFDTPVEEEKKEETKTT